MECYTWKSNTQFKPNDQYCRVWIKLGHQVIISHFRSGRSITGFFVETQDDKVSLNKEEAECIVENFKLGGSIFELASYLWDWQAACNL